MGLRVNDPFLEVMVCVEVFLLGVLTKFLPKVRTEGGWVVGQSMKEAKGGVPVVDGSLVVGSGD